MEFSQQIREIFSLSCFHVLITFKLKRLLPATPNWGRIEGKDIDLKTILSTCPDILGVFEHVLGLIRPHKLLCHQQTPAANNLTFDLMCSGWPFMKTKNKNGPNTEPCGTPEVTDTWEDFSFSKRTVCDLFD